MKEVQPLAALAVDEPTAAAALAFEERVFAALGRRTAWTEARR